MYAAFIAQTGVDLKALIGYTSEKASSPLSDIVDAYFVAKYTFTHG